MVWQKSKSISIAIGALCIMLGIMGIYVACSGNHPKGINELWQQELDHNNLEGKTIVVRGDVVFEPLSDFRFNSLYLVDTATPSERRTPADGFWFGIRIDGVSCIVDTNANWTTCAPFDPTRATTFEFKGTVHLEQIGKKKIMWLSDVEFAHSHQLIDGRWQPIPLGRYIIPLEKN
jgi:hypothetical protein